MKNILLAVVILVLAGGTYLYLRNNPSSVPTASNSITPVSETITVTGGEFFYNPNEIKVRQGDRVKIIFTNSGGFHDFVIDELNVRTQQVPAGQSESVEFTADKKGTFEFYCSVGNHRAMGMKGNLIVE